MLYLTFVQEIVVNLVSVIKMVSVIMGDVNVKKTLKEMVIVIANVSSTRSIYNKTYLYSKK